MVWHIICIAASFIFGTLLVVCIALIIPKFAPKVHFEVIKVYGAIIILSRSWRLYILLNAEQLCYRTYWWGCNFPMTGRMVSQISAPGLIYAGIFYLPILSWPACVWGTRPARTPASRPSCSQRPAFRYTAQTVQYSLLVRLCWVITSLWKSIMGLL